MIFHQLDRLACNRADDVLLTEQIRATDTSTAYQHADLPLRQQLNQAVFASIRIGREPDQIDHDLA